MANKIELKPGDEFYIWNSLQGKSEKLYRRVNANGGVEIDTGFVVADTSHPVYQTHFAGWINRPSLQSQPSPAQSDIVSLLQRAIEEQNDYIADMEEEAAALYAEWEEVADKVGAAEAKLERMLEARGLLNDNS